jgi:Ca2+-transporting ATPase
MLEVRCFAMPGLSSAEALARLATVGPNALPAPLPLRWWHRLTRQFRSPLVLLLVGAMLFDTGVWLAQGHEGWPVEALAIATILVLNAWLGLAQERRSEQALDHLNALAAPSAWVRRDGRLTRVAAATLVPGDWVRLDAGDRIPADGTLRQARGVMLDESVLTGESVPVDRAAGDAAMSGTLLVRGSAWLEVTRTGPASSMGQLATLLGGIVATSTPLERRIDRLGQQVARTVLMLAVALGIAGIAAEGWSRASDMVIFAVALAVAAVPEGLPAVLTVTLALGVERMARRRAVVRRLAAVEALGAVTVICTDKTGTLTDNRMDVRGLHTGATTEAHRAMALVNDAELDTGAGDPLDLGLLRYLRAQGTDVAAIRASAPVVAARPFDSLWKYARTTVQTMDGRRSYLKGAPEVLLARSALDEQNRLQWADLADREAAQGLRVLALATGTDTEETALTWLGLVTMWDPPRPEVSDAIAAAHAAGIRIVMMTGDHPATASAIARQIGCAATAPVTGADLDTAGADQLTRLLTDTGVFARVRPEQKLAIVETLQQQGAIVAVTGDGVNDAPALKRADVGVAMGIRGSDVTREVADLVLLDDNFATIVGAIEEGRGIYENIQKFLRFLFSTNLSEVLLVASGAVLAFALNLRNDTGGLLLPLTAAQILWINLVTDGLPALALALDRTPDLMRQPPRPTDAPLLDRPSLQFVAGAGILKATIALGLLGLVPQLGFDMTQTRAATFHFMAIGQVLFAYPARHTTTYPLPNYTLHAAVLLGISIQLAAGMIPPLSRLLGDAALPGPLWGLVAVAALASWAGAEALTRILWRPHRA